MLSVSTKSGISTTRATSPPSMIAPLGPALQEEIPAVEAATRLRGNFETDLCRDNHTYEAWVMAVDSMFFRVLDFGLIKGDMASFTGHDKLMLSESLARTIFRRQRPHRAEPPVRECHATHGRGNLPRSAPQHPPRGLQRPDSLRRPRRQLLHGLGRRRLVPHLPQAPRGTHPSDVEALLPAFFERHGLTKEHRAVRLALPAAARHALGTDRHHARTDHTHSSGAGAADSLRGVMNYVLLSISSLASRAKTFAMLRCNGARRGTCSPSSSARR